MASTSEGIARSRPTGILRGWLSSQRNFKPTADHHIYHHGHWGDRYDCPF